jgi:hypothetical protein
MGQRLEDLVQRLSVENAELKRENVGLRAGIDPAWARMRADNKAFAMHARHEMEQMYQMAVALG